MPVPVAIAAAVAFIARSAISAGAKRALTSSVLKKVIEPTIAKKIIRGALRGQANERTVDVRIRKMLDANIKELMAPEKGTVQKPFVTVSKPVSRRSGKTKPSPVEVRKMTKEELAAVRDKARARMEKKEKINLQPPAAKTKPRKLTPEEAKAVLRRERKQTAKASKKEKKLIKKQENAEKRLIQKQEKKFTDKTKVVLYDKEGRVIGITTKGKQAQTEYKAKQAESNPENSPTVPGKQDSIKTREKATKKDVGQDYKPVSDTAPATKDIYVYVRNPLTGKRLLSKSGKPLVQKITINTNKGQTEELQRIANELIDKLGPLRAGKNITDKSGKIFVPIKYDVRRGRAENIQYAKTYNPAQIRREFERAAEARAIEGAKAVGVGKEDVSKAAQLAAEAGRKASKALNKNVAKKLTADKQLEMLKKNLFQIEKQLRKPATKQSKAKLDSLLKEKEGIQKNISRLEKRDNIVPEGVKSGA
jgi:hypothetical protein